MTMFVRYSLLVGVSLLTACGEAPPPEAVRARPVTVIVAEAVSPPAGGDVMAVAESFRDEAIGFEVDGRVLFSERLGAEVSGPSLDRDGAISKDDRGSVLAQLDRTRASLALKSAELALAAARSTLATRKVDATVAAPADVARTEAQAAASKDAITAAEEDVKAKTAAFELAKGNLDRERILQGNGSGTQQDLDNAQRDFDSAEARLAQARVSVAGKTQSYNAAVAAVASAEGAKRLKESMVEEARAEVSRLENEVARARENLDDCTLHAPFSGRVTRQLIGRGGIVRPGEAVLQLTMMDPIKLVVTATGDESRKLPPGTRVKLLPAGLKLPDGATSLEGTVLGKPEVADPATRTFRVEILARNINRKTADARGAQLIRNVMPVLRKDPLTEGGLHVPDSAILEDGGKTYVLRVIKAGDRQGSVLESGKIYKPERVEVKRTGSYFSIVNWNFAAIADGSGLAPRDILVLQPTAESEKGVTLAGFDWAIRPGDLVPLSFDLGGLADGIYVPVRAIRNLNGKLSVFVVGDDGIVTEKPVTVHETWGDRRRIEGVPAGARIVIEGLHFIASGDQVVATEAGAEG